MEDPCSKNWEIISRGIAGDIRDPQSKLVCCRLVGDIYLQALVVRGFAKVSQCSPETGASLGVLYNTSFAPDTQGALNQRLKHPPVGVVWKLGEGVPSQVSSSSLDYGSKLRGLSPTTD
ncbi:hypothetical protein TNCV_3412851 [Trichonephila clavipes]|uniref:Uncharacterized protein n=1 Tax=Trichonephila clavipes TaxID=2585209 RepID=A0A8X6RJU4_TRICX|nr:hypothetical protein TNCV_3412851 [Trichonephila clavipes]